MVLSWVELYDFLEILKKGTLLDTYELPTYFLVYAIINIHVDQIYKTI